MTTIIPLTELDISLADLAELFYTKNWYPASADDIDVEDYLRETLSDLLHIALFRGEKGPTEAETLRLSIRKYPEDGYAKIYLTIGSITWQEREDA